jgi:SAM-dependent methyltransferase
MLDRARAKPVAAAVRFLRHDLAHPLPLPTASFDRVLCCLVVDHIASLDSLFREFARVCRTGGAILLSVMHPAMMLRGVQARFTDPATGEVVRPASVPNQLSDYVMAGSRAGLAIDHLSEHRGDEELASRVPRAAKYLDWPMLLMMRLRPPAR